MEKAHFLLLTFQKHHGQVGIEDFQGDTGKPGASADIQGKPVLWQTAGGNQGVQQMLDEEFVRTGDARQIDAAIPMQHELTVPVAKAGLLVGH